MFGAFQSLWPRECPGCGVVVTAAMCGGCLADVELRPVPVDGVVAFAIAPYASALAAILRRAKYGGGDRRICAALGAVLAERCGALIGGFSTVVPAPTPWTRRVSRGFSPPVLLARPVAKVVRAPVSHALALDPGPAQASLDGRARRKNLDGRVHLARPVSGAVLLVDDAVTTGSTARACAAKLREGGAEDVVLLCLVSTDAGRS